MKVVLPFRGEFGLKLQYHVPAVRAIAGPKVVYIEEGEQALYPDATQWIEVERNRDELRRNTYAKDSGVPAFRDVARKRFPQADMLKPDESWPRKRFVPQPHVRQGVTCDVVIAPRRRAYGPDKNWSHWATLADRLMAEGVSVFAGGAPDSSYDVPCPKAWDYERFLDATIEAMHSARLVVATEAGLGPLAVLCGRPLLIITHADGLVAPGPVRNQFGKVMEPAYWPIRMELHEEANHTGSPIEVLKHAWYDPGKAFTRTMELLNADVRVQP